MGGGSTTLSLTALLCLGLCWRPWDQVQAVGDSGLWEDEAPQASNTAWFRFESLSSRHAGQYQCAYHSRNSSSRQSDPLALVVTGLYTAPSLSAHPSPVMASGRNMSLSCSSWFTSGMLHLLKQGGADAPRRSARGKRGNSGGRQALFPVGPVNASHGGTYRCYDSPSSDPYLWSQPSDPLHLQVTGVYREPSLSAQPGSLVLLGDRLTLQCRSDASFGRFALTKDEGSTPPLHLNGQHSPDFPLGRVSHTRGGRYRCYAAHNLSDAWLAPSALLDVLIAGMYQKPSLSAHPGTSVSWGENVTLQCRSEITGVGHLPLVQGGVAGSCPEPESAGHSCTPSGQLHLESYDLSPPWDLQVLWLTQHLPLCPVKPQ